MKPDDLLPGGAHATGIIRGHVAGTAAASTGLIGVAGDPTGATANEVTNLVFPGQTLVDLGSGVGEVVVNAVIGIYTNASGTGRLRGDVVVISSAADKAFTTTTTAQDTRPVGVLLEDIAPDATGAVQTGGEVLFVNVTALVARGTFGETSTTAGAAEANATIRTGTFCQFLTSGTSPAALIIPATVTATPGAYLTNTGGAKDVIQITTAAGAAFTIDCSAANIFDVTLTANCAFAITNAPASGYAGQILVILRQGGSGSYAVTWPASVKWQDASGGNTGSAPMLYTAVGAQDDIMLTTVDAGTTWGGVHLATGNGTVTSVALTVPAEFSVSGSPVTGSGTFALSKATELANTAWMGPTSGAAAQPTFRALVVDDYPFHSEVLCDSAGPILDSHGDVVMVVGVPN